MDLRGLAVFVNVVNVRNAPSCDGRRPSALITIRTATRPVALDAHDTGLGDLAGVMPPTYKRERGRKSKV